MIDAAGVGTTADQIVMLERGALDPLTAKRLDGARAIHTHRSFTRHLVFQSPTPEETE